MYHELTSRLITLVEYRNGRFAVIKPREFLSTGSRLTGVSSRKLLSSTRRSVKELRKSTGGKFMRRQSRFSGCGVSHLNW